MREKFRNRSRTGERASERRRWRGWNLLPSPLPSFPTLQQNHKSAGIASCCIREATRRHTPSSSGLLPFPRPVPSPDDDPFPTPPFSPPCMHTRPSFYFCNRVSLCFARRPRGPTNPFAPTPLSFSSLNRLRSVFPA